jgi:uncharacterized protein YciI
VVDYFLVTRAWGPAWDPTRPRRGQDGWDEHAAFMDALVDEGFVVLGGPVGDVDTGRALLVVRAESEEAVRERLAADPWPAELLTIESAEPWSVWLRPRPTETGEAAERPGSS